MNEITINLGNFGGPVLLGRGKAKTVREKCRLDDIDNSDVHVKVKIPSEIYSIGSSFFLGVFGESIRKAGSKEAFLGKFEFDVDKEIFDTIIENNITRALFERSQLVGKK